MYGKLAGYEKNGQLVTIHYEKQDMTLHVLTPEIINVFVPFYTKEHRSKAIEGNKELPTTFRIEEISQSD